MEIQKAHSSPSLTQAIGSVFFLLGILSFLLIPMPSHTFLWKAVNNFAHVPVFGLATILLLILSRMWFTSSSGSPIRHYWVAMMGALALALLTEALQSFSATRQAEVSDILLDLVGATCGLGLFLTFDPLSRGKWAHWREFPRHAIIRLCVGVVLGITLVPVVGWAYAYLDRASRFPSLLQFSSDLEMKFVTNSDSELQVVVPPDGWKKSAEDLVGRVLFHPKKYPGIRLEEIYPDWRGYTHFLFEIFSDLPVPQSIAIRIDDFHHNNEHVDRFNKTFIVTPGLNQIQIPLDEIRLGPVSRELDLSAIKAVLLFARNPSEEFSLYLDNFHLE